MKKVLLISESRIKENSNLNDNVWGDYLLPAIRTSQDMGLQMIIGTCLFDKLCELVEDGSITAATNTAYKELLDSYIEDYLTYQVISDLVPIIGVKLANIGIVISNDEHLTNISEGEREDIQHFYAMKADFYAKRLQNFLMANKEAYPELECGCSCDGKIKPNLDSAASTSLWLGGYRGRRKK